MTSRKPFAGSLLAATLLAFAGCSTFDSDLRNSSDSSGSGSGSRSSGSGGGAHVSQSYQRDVYSFAVACLGRDEPAGELVRGVGLIAELHGISDWESAPDTSAALHAVVLTGELDERGIARLRDELAPLAPGLIANAFEGRVNPVGNAGGRN